MKYTVSGSTLQYKVGLTLSFLSLISRGVGPFQKGNTSIVVLRDYDVLLLYTVLLVISRPIRAGDGRAEWR